MQKAVIDSIVAEHYKPVLKYCNKHLHGDVHAAEDCTQEVFLILYQKVNSLDMTKDIRPWLYRTADRVMRAYKRKNPEMVDIDSIPEIAVEPELHESVLDVLSEDERTLVDSYYSDKDKFQIAKERGITLKSLYLKIARIKGKLLKEIKKTDKKK